jgi:hypothetical protein
MSAYRAVPHLTFATALLGAVSATSVAVAAPCTGPGAPTNTQTKCLTAVQIPGNPLRSFDISFVNPNRAEYYLADRSNAGIEIIDTASNTFKRRLPGFVGIVLTGAGAVNNNLSGPDGVVTHNRWLYAGDGNSTLKVFDLNAPTASAQKQSIFTGGGTRVDEMDLTTDGKLLLAANNAEDPPFATLFRANGDDSTSHTTIFSKITISTAIVPTGNGLSIEQPAWEPKTARFYTSVPVIANNPTGCNFGQLSGPITCDGGLMIVDPTVVTPGAYVVGPYNPATNTGVLPLHQCGPNGATVGVHTDIMLGCTPQNNPSNTTTQTISATTKNYVSIANITGSDEVWFNAGDRRYYTGSSRACGLAAGCPTGGAVLGVIGADNILIEKIPQSTNSHSVAADSERNTIFVPQVAPAAVVGAGGDTTTVGAGICGSTNGCVGVYIHRVDNDDNDDHDGDHHDGDHDGHDHH